MHKRWAEKRPLFRCARDPAHAAAWAYLGDVLLREEKPTEAARALEKAVKLDSKIRLAHLDLGILSIDSKEYERAKSELDRAIGLDSNKSDAHFQLARMYRAMGREKEAHAELEILRG